MSASKKLCVWQKKAGLNDFKAAKKLGISELLFFYLKNGEVTHPEIAKHIGKIIGLSELEIEELMPVNYRPHGGDYEPGRYKEDLRREPVLFPTGYLSINSHQTPT